MDFDRNGLEILDRDQCLELLAGAPIARIAVTIDALPVILPVNFVLAGNQIVLRSAKGTKLTAAMRNAVVALEVDAFDPLDHSGWSVLVRGSSRVITDETELESVRHLPLRSWANEHTDHFVSIAVDAVSGRRSRPGFGR